MVGIPHCHKHKIDKECLPGCNAHPDNWYCYKCDSEYEEKRGANKMSFKFSLKQRVEIGISDERGIITGQAHFTNSCDRYMVLYKAGDGRAVESWWDESALSAIRLEDEQ